MHTINNKAELDLLLRCSRTRLNYSDIEQINRLITPEIDWDYLIETARRHGVAPLLYRNLKEHAPALLPEKEYALLRDHYLRNSGHNLRLLHELKRVTKAFADRNIPMIPFKGPALAEIIYGNVAWRKASCDLDIVVLKSNVHAAIDILEEMGYRRSEAVTPKSLYKKLKYRYHLSFIRPSGVMLELHWHIVPLYMATFAMPDLFARRFNINSPEIACSTFAPEDLFLLLCIHATKDFWLSLSLVCDLNELLAKHANLDQTALLNIARKQGHLRIALVGFYLTKTLFSASLSPAVEKAIATDPKAARLAVQIAETLFSKKDGAVNPA